MTQQMEKNPLESDEKSLTTDTSFDTDVWVRKMFGVGRVGRIDKELLIILKDKYIDKENFVTTQGQHGRCRWGDFWVEIASRAHYGEWVREEKDMIKFMRFLKGRVRRELGMLDTETKEMKQMIVLKVQKGIYNKYGFIELKYWMYKEHLIDPLSKLYDRYEWLTKFYSGDKPISKYDLNIPKAKEALIGNMLEVTGEKAGGNRVFYKCPIHKEKTASFVWYKGNNTWYCFGCGRGGDSIELYQILHNCGFKEAVLTLQAYVH